MPEVSKEEIRAQLHRLFEDEDADLSEQDVKLVRRLATENGNSAAAVMDKIGDIVYEELKNSKLFQEELQEIYLRFDINVQPYEKRVEKACEEYMLQVFIIGFQEMLIAEVIDLLPEHSDKDIVEILNAKYGDEDEEQDAIEMSEEEKEQFRELSLICIGLARKLSQGNNKSAKEIMDVESTNLYAYFKSSDAIKVSMQRKNLLAAFDEFMVEVCLYGFETILDRVIQMAPEHSDEEIFDIFSAEIEDYENKSKAKVSDERPKLRFTAQ